LPRGGGSPPNVMPILYVVDADGRVTWCDDLARYRHEEPDEFVAELAAQIDQALDQALERKGRSPGPG
ncbi:MAG TPA: hypothetical protein VML55_18810, partial [Planctomycetaceae bacterium]|nr:hypothetical protein [Planctomycetaceae bacterium]